MYLQQILKWAIFSEKYEPIIAQESFHFVGSRGRPLKLSSRTGVEDQCRVVHDLLRISLARVTPLSATSIMLQISLSPQIKTTKQTNKINKQNKQTKNYTYFPAQIISLPYLNFFVDRLDRRKRRIGTVHWLKPNPFL